jgi:rubrerythrin
MDHKQLPDKDALLAAIEMEERGYTFFRDAAGKAPDVFAKEVFNYLADEEQNHIRAIRKFNTEAVGGRLGDADKVIADLKAGRPKTSIAKIFDQLKDKTPTTGRDLDVYRFAMDFELKGEAFYKKAETEAVDPNAKKLYAFLIGEERKHFKIVESCMDYFENPAEFFHRREKWHVEG